MREEKIAMKKEWIIYWVFFGWWLIPILIVSIVLGGLIVNAIRFTFGTAFEIIYGMNTRLNKF